MNKIHHLERALTYLRSLSVLRVNSLSMRCFSTDKDSETQSNDSPSARLQDSTSVESGTEEAITQTKEKTETSESEAKLSGFARSYKKFSHINDKKPKTAQTFASLIRNSKFVDVNISCLQCIQLCRISIDYFLFNT